MPQHRLGPPRLCAQDSQRGQRGTDSRRRETGVEDERPGGVDEVIAHGRGCERCAALAAERFGQRGRHHHIGRTGQSQLVQQPAPAESAHTQAMGLVDDQQRPVPAAHLVQLPHRRQCAIGGKHRLGDDDGPLLIPRPQCRVYGIDVAVRITTTQALDRRHASTSEACE